MSEPVRFERKVLAEPNDLRTAWEATAQEFVSWARKPGHDSYWRYHRDVFLELVPPPGRLTVAIGCGEGRFSHDLAALGHSIVAVDGSATMVAAARDADPESDVRLADAAALPLPDGAADLAIAFMSLQESATPQLQSANPLAYSSKADTSVLQSSIQWRLPASSRRSSPTART